MIVLEKFFLLERKTSSRETKNQRRKAGGEKKEEEPFSAPFFLHDSKETNKICYKVTSSVDNTY